MGSVEGCSHCFGTVTISAWSIIWAVILLSDDSALRAGYLFLNVEKTIGDAAEGFDVAEYEEVGKFKKFECPVEDLGRHGVDGSSAYSCVSAECKVSHAWEESDVRRGKKAWS